MRHFLRCALLLALGSSALASAAPVSAHDHDHDGQATYLANEAVMVEKGDVKILFDPLFNQSYGTYLLVPEDLRKTMMKGEAPFDNIDIVFISHAHGDHFSAQPMLEFLRNHSQTKLVASTQAVEALRKVTTKEDTHIFERITTLTLGPDDPPLRFILDGVEIDAVRIPHAGGPGRASVQNYVLRVALDSDTRVMHMGDSDPAMRFFAPLDAHWQEKRTRLAMPPYWFFLSDEGRKIMDEHLNAEHYTGVHVPANAEAVRRQYPDALKDADLFTRPSETRALD